MIEIWADIKGFKGYYQVSSEGRIKSLERKVACRRGKIATKKERILKPCFSKTENLHKIILTDGVSSKHYRLNRLVAEAFVPNPYNYQYVYHIDGDTTNCRAENLEFSKFYLTKNGDLRDKEIAIPMS